jgi:hypothetical protein
MLKLQDPSGREFFYFAGKIATNYKNHISLKAVHVPMMPHGHHTIKTTIHFLTRISARAQNYQ